MLNQESNLQFSQTPIPKSTFPKAVHTLPFMPQNMCHMYIFPLIPSIRPQMPQIYTIVASFPQQLHNTRLAKCPVILCGTHK